MSKYPDLKHNLINILRIPQGSFNQPWNQGRFEELLRQSQTLRKQKFRLRVAHGGRRPQVTTINTALRQFTFRPF